MSASVRRHRSTRRCIAVLIATLGGSVVGGCVADGGYGPADPTTKSAQLLDTA